MIFTARAAIVFFSVTVFMLRVAGPCNCNKNDCSDTSPRVATPGIFFELKDKISDTNIIAFTGMPSAVPDSIRLKNLATGVNYPLYVGLWPSGTRVYSDQYNRPASVVDSLVFYFGNSVPDTLIVYTGIVDGYRGDECPAVREPGITKVVLRNQVLVETTMDIPVFTLKK